MQKALTTPVTTQFQQRVMERYGFSYDARNNPKLISFPQARPLYNPLDTTDHVAAHGEWCLKRVASGAAKATIQAILDEHARQKEAA